MIRYGSKTVKAITSLFLYSPGGFHSLIGWQGLHLWYFWSTVRLGCKVDNFFFNLIYNFLKLCSRFTVANLHQL